MSGNIIVEVGKSIPIVLQIADGATDQYPQAEIRDDTNTLLTTLDLSHVASGMYRAAYVMPNENFIVATYIVYTDAGHTTVSTDYQRDIDTFVKVGYEGQLTGINASLDEAKGATFETSTDSQEAIRNRGDIAWDWWNWRHATGPI